MKIRILDIDWDLYDEDSGETLTPEQAGVPEYVDIEVLSASSRRPSDEDVYAAAAEYMDSNFDWCYKSFRWKEGWGKKHRAKKAGGRKR